MATPVIFGISIALIIVLVLFGTFFLTAVLPTLNTDKKHKKEVRNLKEQIIRMNEGEQPDSEIAVDNTSGSEIAVDNTSDNAVDFTSDDENVQTEDDFSDDGFDDIYYEEEAALCSEEPCAVSGDDDGSVPADNDDGTECDAEDDVDGESEDDTAAETASELEDGKRYDRSFRARLIQSDELLKSRYSLIKNAALSYDGVKSSIGWKQERLHFGKNLIAKLIIRGKTLCVFLPIDVEEAGRAKVEDVSKRAINAAAPTMLRIKNSLRLKQAVELIREICEGLGLTAGEEQTVDYARKYGYMTSEELLEAGLIKIAKQTAFGEFSAQK